ncbi:MULTISPECIES: SAM-dependent methyltransferase [unclassified Streptomyces]|uniref:O-methyltransferase n=1 Tax=unclassified Streptomyces TaxID=2593676 RepID=UPI00136DF3A7|nr:MULTISPECIES: SAM-dependent methyltransferase [unclassified Streptomyces]NDZ97742.1 SAM-dependent methyltransferase [Streptomyces sp. SID10116]MYY87140.1 SAM-dependent methyltransferase [Streptomyces sp. SID335]MYZ15922.1 SAM-dependent methyltransferase [Streptomyces sp. SID337]NDZ90923.1 SAM-dependent methyltransferase [Streptomyces sp. SID10115]NEB46597.1 SAM-dependent methyltransferase [Streptomyces sp. SID339]
MSTSGTDAYAGLTGLPDLVAEAVELARRLGFPSSCRPEQGRLLHALAAGARDGIGETGTGCGVGLAWMIAGRRPGVRIVSVERDQVRAEAAAELFADVPDVEILCGDWTRIYEHGPFDLLVPDGGGNGKKTSPVDPERLLRPAGTIVIDDFTPMTQWPPLIDGQPDTARLAWLEHPALLCAEVRLAPGLSTLIGTRRP